MAFTLMDGTTNMQPMVKHRISALVFFYLLSSQRECVKMNVILSSFGAVIHIGRPRHQRCTDSNSRIGMTDLGQIKRIGNFLGLGGPKKVHPPSVRIGIIGASKVGKPPCNLMSFNVHVMPSLARGDPCSIP